MNRQKLLAYRKQLGNRGESAAAELYTALGYHVVERNWRCRAGELDIVLIRNNEIIFAEVKSMRYRQGVQPEINLSSHQRRRNFRAARFYLKCSAVSNLTGRFDLIAVTFGRFGIRSIRRYRDYLPILPAEEES